MHPVVQLAKTEISWEKKKADGSEKYPPPDVVQMAYDVLNAENDVIEYHISQIKLRQFYERNRTKGYPKPKFSVVLTFTQF